MISRTRRNTICPRNASGWYAWLQRNHATRSGIWLRCYKAAAARSNLDWDQAVDAALCFGWIDSVRYTHDDDSYVQYFSPRKARSPWSRVNKEKVERLREQGRMTPAGLAAIATARENGSWTWLDSAERDEIPADLREELARHPGAAPFVAELSPSRRKLLLHWICLARRPETRRQRIIEIGRCAAEGVMPKPFRAGEK